MTHTRGEMPGDDPNQPPHREFCLVGCKTTSPFMRHAFLLGVPSAPGGTQSAPVDHFVDGESPTLQERHAPRSHTVEAVLLEAEWSVPEESGVVPFSLRSVPTAVDEQKCLRPWFCDGEVQVLGVQLRVCSWNDSACSPVVWTDRAAPFHVAS